MNKMKEIQVDKVIVNFGAGKDAKRLDNGIQIIKMITDQEPVKTYTEVRIPAWGLRPGLPVGAKLTLRGEEANKLLKRFLTAKNNKLPASCVDDYGNVSFGVPEYIDIPDVKYDPKVGVMGLQMSVKLTRPGFRVARRKLQTSKIGKSHQIRKEEAQEFLTKNFGVEFIQ